MEISEARKKKLKELILTKTSRTGKCWIWKGAKSNGIGIVRVEDKPYSVQRVAYIVFELKPALEDFVVDTVCGNRDCVNPAHLVRTTVRRGGLSGRNCSSYHKPYPWDEWFYLHKGEDVTIQRGVDFDIQVLAMAQQVRNKASKKGFTVRITTGEDYLTFRVYGNEDSTLPKTVG